KLLSSDRLHKASSNALAIDLNSVDEVVEAANAMRADPDALFLVQRMLPAGVDIFCGFVLDPNYGGMLILGAGGGEVETMLDTRTLLLPATREDIASAL